MESSSRTLPWYLDLSERAYTYPDDAVRITVDLETTNGEKGSPLLAENRIVTCAFAVGSGPVVSGPDALDSLRQYSGQKAVLVAHNAKFELQWLNREGFDTSQWLPFDTMLAEYVIAGNRKWKLDLDSVARRYGLRGKGRVVARMMEAGVCPSMMPAQWVDERVRGDVVLTRSVSEQQLSRLRSDGLVRVAFTRNIATPVLAVIETHGMCLDPERVISEYELAVKERSLILESLETLTGGLNMNSRPSLGKFLYETLGFRELTDRKGEPLRTPSGNRKTDKNTILALKAETPEQKEFIEVQTKYSIVDAALSKTLAFLYGSVIERDSRFFGRFNQTVTQTHRLSATGRPTTFGLWPKKKKSVQFQNFPRRFKRLFTTRSVTSTTSQTEPVSRRIVEVDGATLEFRVAGTLSRDPQILSDVVSGADVHRYTGAVLNAVPEDQVTDSQRTSAKSRTFKPLYGGNSGTKREMEYYEAFRKKYQATYDEQMRWVYEVLDKKQLRIPSGLVFYWPDTAMTRSGYITNTPSIFNYPVQSIATADIIPVSLVYTFWESRANGLDVMIVNTVHDSVVADVAEKDVDAYKQVAVECFLDKTYSYMSEVYGMDMYIPLGVGIKVGTHWGEGKEEKVSYPRKAA